MTPATELSRAGKIAAIHALADFYKDRPDVPMPTTIHSRHDAWPVAVDEVAAVEQCLTFAADFQIKPTEDRSGIVRADLSLIDTPGFHVYVVHSVFTVAQPPTRWVK